MNQNCSLVLKGLKCDNPSCDWRDDTIPEEKYPEYINFKCPKCGENVLTLEDYSLILDLRRAEETLNSIPPDMLEVLASGLTIDDIKNHPAFKDIPGVQELESLDQLVTFELNAHKEISIERIKISDNEH